MPYNNEISRTDAQALIPEDVSDAMMEEISGESAALTLFRKVPISTNQIRMPVLSALPIAYFVNGDTGLKQTTEMAWENAYFNVEEIAAIVPVPENVIDDASFDMWEAIRPALQTAIARALDNAIFFAVNKPGSWPAAVMTGATAAGNVIERGTNNAAAGGVAEDISQLMSTIEVDGYDISAAIAKSAMRGVARAIRTSTGERTMDVTATNWWGIDVSYPMRGLWPAVVDAIIGDFSKGLLGVRKDFTWKILDQAVIQDGNGAIVFNLAQQDMLAMRVVSRFAFQVANPINYEQTDVAARYPFGLLKNES